MKNVNTHKGYKHAFGKNKKHKTEENNPIKKKSRAINRSTKKKITNQHGSTKFPV